MLYSKRFHLFHGSHLFNGMKLVRARGNLQPSPGFWNPVWWAVGEVFTCTYFSQGRALSVILHWHNFRAKLKMCGFASNEALDYLSEDSPTSDRVKVRSSIFCWMHPLSTSLQSLYSECEHILHSTHGHKTWAKHSEQSIITPVL